MILMRDANVSPHFEKGEKGATIMFVIATPSL